MATLELTIINSILRYPLLYKDINFVYSKENVLDHLFFVNGNGYEWVDGELITDEPLMHDCIPDNYFDTKIMDKDGYEILNTIPLNIYPICEYAKILSLPDDIKPDWLAGAEEALKLAQDYYNDPYKHCNGSYISSWIDKRNFAAIPKYIDGQKKFLDIAEKRINILKGTILNDK